MSNFSDFIGSSDSGAAVEVGELAQFLAEADPLQQDMITKADGSVFLKTGVMTDDVATYPATAMETMSWGNSGYSFQPRDGYDSYGASFFTKGGHPYYMAGALLPNQSQWNGAWYNINSGQNGGTGNASNPFGNWASWFSIRVMVSWDTNKVWYLGYDPSSAGGVYRWGGADLSYSSNGNLSSGNTQGGNDTALADSAFTSAIGGSNSHSQFRHLVDNNNKLYVIEINDEKVDGVSNALNDDTRRSNVYRFNVAGNPHKPVYEATFTVDHPYAATFTFDFDANKLCIVATNAIVTRPFSTSNWNGADSIIAIGHELVNSQNAGAGNNFVAYRGLSANGNPEFWKVNSSLSGLQYFECKQRSGYSLALQEPAGAHTIPYYLRIK